MYKRVNKYQLKVYDLYVNGEYTATGTADELSEQTGIPRDRVRNMSKNQYLVDTGKTKETTVVHDCKRKQGKKRGTYAFYRGDDLIQIGTRHEIAEKQGLKLQTLTLYQGVTWKKRYPHGPHMYRLEDDDDI